MTAPSTQKIVRSRSSLRPLTALRLAWGCWFVFLIIPFFVAYWFIWHTAGEQSPLAHASEERWFVAAMAYLGLVAPAAFFWRERIFKSYRTGKTVPPRTYLLGMIGVGLALLTSGLFSLTGCIVVGTLMPNLFPAFLALLLFLMLWPTGKSTRLNAGPMGQLSRYIT